MPRDGTNNLIPVTKRSKDEAREMSRKGGVNSGKTRRRQASLRKAFKEVLKSKVEVNGKKMTVSEALAISATKKALMQGSLDDILKIARLAGEDLDTAAESNERRSRTELNAAKIKYTEAQSKSVEAMNTQEDGIDDDGFIAALEGTADEDWEETE